MSILEEKLNPLITSVKISLENKNHYAALTVALSLPDVCASLQNGGQTSKKLYTKFIEDYFLPIHSYDQGFVKASDFYALRCAILHNSTTNIEEQRARELINKFVLTYSTSGNIFLHNNYSINNGGTNETNLNIDIHEFCLEIIDAVKSFKFLNKDNESINKTASEMMSIINTDYGFSF
ncbi:hypothetical protein ACTQ5J_02120 [Fundicoccus sp. Sow4_F4]|uniref:hypothetical protein n=1 Tax=Fundicoccus sp. Sow4_F4 TaxID=3438783 RepID=UPI003F8DC43D